MAKISRSTFFTVLAASGAFVLTGCGSGTPKNSNYTGSYRSAYTISSLNEAGTFDFTIDVKGRVQGTLDNQTGKVREFSGEIKNNGEIVGDTFDRANNVRGSLTGKVAGDGADAVSVTGGNFTLTENNAPAVGNFQVGATVPAPGSSGYQGFYNGVYTIPALNQNGTTSFSVDSAGKMTGSLTRGSETGLLTGTVSSNGNFTATVAFANETTTLTGTLVKTTDNSTLGNFTQTVNGTVVAGSFGPTTVKTGDSQYQGAYRGTYGIPEQGENGNVSFTVDPSGALTGFFSQANNSPIGTFTGAFNNDGRFTGTVTYDSSTGIAARPITGKLGSSTLNGGLAGDFVMTVNGVNKPGNFEVSVGASEPNSQYRASYSSFPGNSLYFGGAPGLNDSDNCEFSVDQQGSILGKFGEYSVTGRITNDGRIVGTIVANGNNYAFRGILNKLIYKFQIPGPNGTSTEVTSNGIKGDLIFTVDGADYTGTLKAIGGDGTTTTRKRK